MKKIFIVLIALVFYSLSVVAAEKFKFKYHNDDSLPKKWVTEFENIIDVLQEVLPIQDNMNDYLKSPGMDIYSWKSSKKKSIS